MQRIHAFETITLRAGRVPFWRVALVLIVACALALALALLVSGLFLILLPVIVVGAVALRFMGRRVAHTPRPGEEIIEAEYEVIEEKRAGEKPAPLSSDDSARAP